LRTELRKKWQAFTGPEQELNKHVGEIMLPQTFARSRMNIFLSTELSLFWILNTQACVSTGLLGEIVLICHGIPSCTYNAKEEKALKEIKVQISCASCESPDSSDGDDNESNANVDAVKMKIMQFSLGKKKNLCSKVSLGNQFPLQRLTVMKSMNISIYHHVSVFETCPRRQSAPRAMLSGHPGVVERTFQTVSAF
jgi:hypothetical protein